MSGLRRNLPPILQMCKLRHREESDLWEVRQQGSGSAEARTRLLSPSIIFSPVSGGSVFCLGGPALSPVLPQGRITPVFSSFWFSFPSILSYFQQPSSLLTSLGLSFFIFKMGTSLLPLLSGLLSLQPLSLGLGQHSVFADTCKELYLMAKLASASPSGPNFFLNYPLNWL